MSLCDCFSSCAVKRLVHFHRDLEFNIKDNKASLSAIGWPIQAVKGMAGVDVFVSESSNDSGVEHQITFYSIFLPKNINLLLFKWKQKQ